MTCFIYERGVVG